jgi:hypothetical protein
MDDIKTQFQQFLDCKANTQSVAEKGLAIISADVIKQINLEQDHCLTIIDGLKKSNSDLLSKYRKGISVTEQRVLSEKKFYQELASTDYKNVPSYDLSANILKMAEDSVWSSLERPSQVVPKTESSVSTMTIVIFLLLILLILYMKFAKKYNINSQKVHEYFDNRSINKKNDVFFKENPKND